MFLQNLIWRQLRTDTYGSVLCEQFNAVLEVRKRARAKRPRMKQKLKG